MKNNLKSIYLNRIILFRYYDFKFSINIYISQFFNQTIWEPILKIRLN